MKTEKELEDEAWRDAKRVFDGQFVLPFTYCTECRPDEGKIHCVANVMTGEALCFKHWFLRHLDELKVKNQSETEPKEPFPVAELKHGGLTPLDLNDFARI